MAQSFSPTPAAGAPKAALAEAQLDPLWDAPLASLDGKPMRLGDFRPKGLLLVNVASRCGLTPQYAGLEALQRKYAARGFSVIGFPCNQFGAQEPGSPAEIASFCSTTYGVTFPLAEKIEVNGPGAHPIYQALVRFPDVDGVAGPIRWNFEKFVVGAGGRSVTRFSPMVTPEDPALVAAVESSLPR